MKRSNNARYDTPLGFRNENRECALASRIQARLEIYGSSEASASTSSDFLELVALLCSNLPEDQDYFWKIVDRSMKRDSARTRRSAEQFRNHVYCRAVYALEPARSPLNIHVNHGKVHSIKHYPRLREAAIGERLPAADRKPARLLVQMPMRTN